MARAKNGTAKKGRGRNGKSVKDFQNGDAANDYRVAVDGDEDPSGHNSKHFEPNGQELRDFLALVRDENQTIQGIMEAARKKCEGPRSAIAKAKKVLIESGYPAQELAVFMRRHRLEWQIEHVGDKLNDDQLLNFRAFVKAIGPFGETPLGNAAIAAAEAALQPH